ADLTLAPWTSPWSPRSEMDPDIGLALETGRSRWSARAAAGSRADVRETWQLYSEQFRAAGGGVGGQEPSQNPLFSAARRRSYGGTFGLGASAWRAWRPDSPRRP